MSYRNPQQVIDTQTGQHYRNLQNVISSTFAGVAQSYKAEQDKLAEEKKKREEKNKQKKLQRQAEEDVVMDETNTVLSGVNAPVGTAGLFERINEYSDLANSLDSGTITDPEEIRKIRQRMSQIRTIPSSLKASLVGMGAVTQEYTEKWSKAGKKGGIDLKNVDPKKIDYIDIFLNKQKGTREFVSVADENGVERVGIFIQSTEEGDKGRTFTADELRSYLDGDTEMLQTIPDDTTQLGIFDRIVEGEGDGRKKGLPKKDFFVKQKEYRDDGTVVNKLVVDQNKLRDSLKPEAISYINSLESSELISFYENILDRNEVMTNQLISEGLLPKDTKVLTSEMVSGDNGEALRARISDMYLDDYISSRRYGEVETIDYIYNPNSKSGGKVDQKQEQAKPLYKQGDIKAKFGSGPGTQVDLGDLKKQLEAKGFVVSDYYTDAIGLGGRTNLKVTFSGVKGPKRQVTINDSMSQEEIDRNLLLVTKSEPIENGTEQYPYPFKSQQKK